MTAKGRANKVIEIIDHEIVNMSNEGLEQLKETQKLKLVYQAFKFVDLLNNVQMQKEINKVRKNAKRYWKRYVKLNRT